MRKRVRAGWLAAFLIAAVAALVVAATATSATRRAPSTRSAIAAPEKPNDYGWNQQGVAERAEGRQGRRAPASRPRRASATRTSSRRSAGSRSAAPT